MCDCMIINITYGFVTSNLWNVKVKLNDAVVMIFASYNLCLYSSLFFLLSIEHIYVREASLFTEWGASFIQKLSQMSRITFIRPMWWSMMMNVKKKIEKNEFKETICPLNRTRKNKCPPSRHCIFCGAPLWTKNWNWPKHLKIT